MGQELRASRLDIGSWKDLIDLELEFHSLPDEWIFRGQGSRKHYLKPTLERAFEDFEITDQNRGAIEIAIITDFKRGAHLYPTPVLPEPTNTIDWLALMRHYGAPSRFLDFSFSLFIAAYFALELGDDPIVWAINKTWLARKFYEQLAALAEGEKMANSWDRREGWIFDRVFIQREPEIVCIAPVNPMIMNDRLAVQQGLFLSPSDINLPFHDILNGIDESEDNVLPIHLNPSERKSMIIHLYRAGVNRAALFPGLEGFAMALRPKMLLFQFLKDKRDKGGRVGPTAIGI